MKLNFQRLISALEQNIRTMRTFEVTRSVGVTPESVRSVLTLDPSLEQIEIVGFSASELFLSETIVKCAFNLKHFSFDSPSSASQADESSLCNFLEKQSATLETLKLSQSIGVKVLETVFKMPRISKLKLNLKNDINWKEVQLPVNRSVNRLQLAEMEETSVDLITTLFGAMPNLRVLLFERQFELNEEVFIRCASLHNIYFNVRFSSDFIFMPNLTKHQISLLSNQLCYDVEDELCERQIPEKESSSTIDFTVEIHTSKSSSKNVTEIKFEQIIMLCMKGQYQYRLHEPNRTLKMF